MNDLLHYFSTTMRQIAKKQFGYIIKADILKCFLRYKLFAFFYSTPYVLFATYRYIYHMSLNGSEVQTLIADPSGILSIDYHYR